MNIRLQTLCIIVRGDEVLLGYKKKGFGRGKWNGFGGKVNEGEAIAIAAKREIEEECGLIARSLTPVGVFEFEFVKNPDNILEVHLFKCADYIGEAIESEEMCPRWFKTDEIPFSEMWDDDKYWFPLFLEDKKFQAKFLFDKDNRVIKHELTPVDILEI